MPLPRGGRRRILEGDRFALFIERQYFPSFGLLAKNIPAKRLRFSEFHRFGNRFGIFDFDDLRSAFDVGVEPDPGRRELEFLVRVEITP